MATLPLLESDLGDDPGTELRLRMSANSVYLNLSAASRSNESLEDINFYRQIEPENARPILKQLPPPRKHVFLRVLFALFHGMGWRCCGLYWVNLLLIPLAIAGAICAIIEISRQIDATLYLSLKYLGKRTAIGEAMELSNMLLICVLFCGSYLLWSFHVHRAKICGPEQASFPAPLQRLDSSSPPSTSPATRREWFLRRHASTWMSGVVLGFVLSESYLTYRLAILLEMHTPMSTMDQTIRILSIVFQLWFFGACAISMVAFYAVTDDVVQVCHGFGRLTGSGNGELLLSPESPPPAQMSSDDLHTPARMEPRSIVIAKQLRFLRDYMDATLKPSKIWFIFHMSVCFMIGALFILTSILPLLVRTPNTPRPEFDGYNVVSLTTQVLGFLVPLHAAARVTNAWDDLVHGVCTDEQLLSQCPVTHHSMALYVRELGGGFRVFGWRVEHAAGLKFLTAILTLDGIIRLL